MSANGDSQRLAALADNLRGAQNMAASPMMRADLGAQMLSVVEQLREIARYTSDYADNLHKGLVTYERRMQEMLGKVGK